MLHGYCRAGPRQQPGPGVGLAEALLASRDTLGGRLTTDWSANRSIGSWYGVTVGGTPERVTRLTITFGLTGELPAELGNLSRLETLSLSGSQLTGRIPAALGNLSELQTLSLSGNQLTGEIPTELGNLSSLESLFLYSNQLTGGIPAELGNLSSLESLSLRGNQLTGGIPVELGDLSRPGIVAAP